MDDQAKVTMSLASPTANQVYIAPASVNVTANAADSDGTVAKVGFYQGTTLIGAALLMKVTAHKGTRMLARYYLRAPKTSPASWGSRARGALRMSGGFEHPHFDVGPSSRRHVRQRIQAEQTDLAAHQVRYTRLSHAKKLGGLRLAHFGAGKVVLQRRHQDGTQLLFSASSGVSSIASQTPANGWLLIALAPSTSHDNA